VSQFASQRVHKAGLQRLSHGKVNVLKALRQWPVVSLIAPLISLVLGTVTSLAGDSRKPSESDAMNLATTNCGAFVLASSFRNVTTRYPDNLVDNDSTTSWQAWDDSFPQWIEVRWQHPAQVSEVHLDAVSPSSVTAASVHGLRGGEWQVLAEVKGENSGSSIRFEQSEVERLRIDLLAGDGGPATLAAVRVIGPAQPILRAIEPYWHASYVWFPEPDRTYKSLHRDFFENPLRCGT
jgi:hypothetical protein